MRLSLLAVLAAPLLAAPLPKGTDAPPYFPVKVGAKRVMEATTSRQPDGAPGFESVDTVTKVEAKDGTYRVTVERETKGKSLVTVYEVSGKGLARVASGGKGSPEPAAMLKLPAKAGETWTRGEAAAKVTLTTGKEEEVEVPAGKFKAVPVTSESDLGGGRPVKSIAWYAPEVGLVKSVTSVNGIDTTYVLKSFTPGK
jgi:hypothetical protein